ncbi:MAG: hypothetical protein RIC56_02725 [Pseudomonadales bacterium]
MIQRTASLVFATLWATGTAHAEVYAYVNDDGDYVVTRELPHARVGEYAVLTDDGEFLRLVNPHELDVPITHWRPWFLPKQPDPYDGNPDLYEEREGVVEIEELDEADER